MSRRGSARRCRPRGRAARSRAPSESGEREDDRAHDRSPRRLRTGPVANAALDLDGVAAASVTTTIGAAPAGSHLGNDDRAGRRSAQRDGRARAVTYAQRARLYRAADPRRRLRELRGAASRRDGRARASPTARRGTASGAKGDSPRPSASAGTLTCNILFDEEHRTNRIGLTARPTGISGGAMDVVELSTA